jgi:hypothetical protein
MRNGRIIGPYNPSSIVSASGIWNLNDVHTSRKNESWPKTPSTLTFRTSTTGFGASPTNSLTLTHPVGVVAGDLCIIFHYYYDTDGDLAAGTSTDFTLFHNRGYNYTGSTWLSFGMRYSVLTGTGNVTLPAAVDNGLSATSAAVNQAYIALYFYLDKTIESVKVLQTTSTQSTADPAARSITASGFTNVPLLILGSQAIITGTPAFNASTSPAFDGTVTNTAGTNIEMLVGYKIYNTNNASDHTIDMDEISTGAAKLLSSYLLSVQ